MSRRGRAPSAREVAAAVVARVLDEGAWVGPALDAALSREGASLSPGDRALVTELVYGTLRWAAPLEQSLLRGTDKPGRGLDKKIRPHLLVAAYQLQHLEDRIPAHAAVNEAVKAVRRVRPGLAGFANALLRRLGSPPHLQLSPGAAPDELARALGVPEVLVEATLRGLPEDERRAALLALNERPPLGLRWLGPDEEEAAFARALEERATSAAPHPFVPHAWLVEGAGAVQELPGFEEGWVQVQDPGSQLVALLASPAPGARALDLAAAPGGKTMILARAAGPSGRVIAVEIDPRRAERIRENVTRIGFENVEVKVADAATLPPAEAFPEGADVALLDAPCTGLGTVRRRPEIKLRKESENAAACSALQSTLIDAAARHVRPGGALVYAVCSPVAEEGPLVVERFLSTHPDFERVPAREVLPFLPEDAVDERGQLRLLPHRHQSDAFFAARLERRGATPGSTT